MTSAPYLTAEISAGAVRRNLDRLRQLLPPTTGLCPVVKANAYGLGLELLAPAISAGADWLAVARPDEALRLRELGWDGPILCFFSLSALGGRLALEAAAELVARAVTLTVVSAAEAELVASAAPADTRVEVHLKVDTGMARAGVWHGEAAGLLAALRAEPRVRLTGAYTHFATADVEDRSFTLEQVRRLLAVVAAAGGRRGLRLHAANSAAVLRSPESHLDMVRPGIAVYGYRPSPVVRPEPPLEPCLRLVARLLQVKRVPAGTATGYGLEYTFDRQSSMGLVSVGYADGYPRALGGRAVVGVRGRTAPVRGRVSMDQIVVDLTDLPEARVGDEVEIVAADPDAPNSLESLALLAGTIPYELTCRLGPRVARRLVE